MMSNWFRKCRLLPMQILLAVTVVLCYVTFNYSGLVKLDPAGHWLKQEEPKRTAFPQADMEFLRTTGVVSHVEISNILDETINEMNTTELIVNLHSFLDNVDIICKRRIRMGYLGDGGWEICDDEGVRPEKPNCLIYAFSVNQDYAFETDAGRVYGCEIHTFNPYLQGADFNRSEQHHVHSFSVGRYSEITASGKELYTFSDIRAILGHVSRDIDVVKMDIEGAEWPALTLILWQEQFKYVKQFLVEFHVGGPDNDDRMRRSLRILRNLSLAGFFKFYATKNTKGSFHHPVFPVVRSKNYEVHYINNRFINSK